MGLRCIRVLGGVILVLTTLVGCAGSDSEAPSTAAPGASSALVLAGEAAVPAEVPAPMRACYQCHQEVVATYLEHGMARSIGPVGAPEPGTVTNPYSGNRYEIYADTQGVWLKGTTPDGGTRYQRLVGRIGAGRFDTSWIGAEVDPFTREDTGRLFFAPVETIADHGLALSPFELRPNAAGLDLGLSHGCLTCHTTGDLTTLPDAAVSPDRRMIYPANALGVDAFEVLQPLGCEDCHGDASRHVTMMSGLPDDAADDLGLESLGRQPAGRQRDVCARCHLQGDARFELIQGPPHPEAPLAGQIPVLVPVRTGDDFRFVGQVERLVLSACFQGTPTMTCTTCHDAHTGVVQQGTASFEATCKGCHDVETPHTPLTVEAVTGEPARTDDGCVDCHVRRSQPFDLPHIRTADHYIRRHIPKPVKAVPHRQFADSTGPVQVFDDGRLAERLRTPAGQRWKAGVLAMGLVTMGRAGEAAQHFALFPAPGSSQAVQPTAPEGLVPLETNASFHHTRGLSLMSTGQPQAALAAFSDALTLDPSEAGARMERARLRVLTGDLKGALEDTDVVLAAHPEADEPWNLRTLMALQIGSPAMAAAALDASTQRWPSDAEAWQQLAWLYRGLGEEASAAQALQRAYALRPSLPSLQRGPSP